MSVRLSGTRPVVGEGAEEASIRGSEPSGTEGWGRVPSGDYNFLQSPYIECERGRWLGDAKLGSEGGQQSGIFSCCGLEP